MTRAIFKQGTETIVIEQADNGRFFITYNVGVSPCTAGSFDTYTEAETMLHKHRPEAVKINDMCADCIRFNKDCDGTHIQSYTGCVFKNK